MAPSFLGPPELRNPIPPPQSRAPAATSGDSFIDQMAADFNQIKIDEMKDNPCLELFYLAEPNKIRQSLTNKLHLAWEHDPLTTLKLICNLRGVRGTGKSDREGFYKAAFWLHGLHPKTLACNLESFANFGCFKDLPEILYRLLEGSNVRKTQRKAWSNRGRRKGSDKTEKGKVSLGRSRFQHKKLPGKSRRRYTIVPREIRILNAMRRSKREKERASVLRKQKKITMAKKVIEKYGRDPDFRFLYERVSDFFADYLKTDMQLLNSGEIRKVSLASKWCPSIDSSFDRSMLLCESIARKVFPRESYPEYEGIEEAHYAYRVRDRLRKEVLVPLRKVLQLPEVYIGANRWDSIRYNRVASVAMMFYKEKFIKHDAERFAKYLEDVKSGKKTIAAGAMLPHEIIAALYDYDDGGQVAELQWRRMVDDLLKKGKLRNCLAMCDVSDRMLGIRMEVSIAMGVLVSELSEEPWKGKLITFSANPRLQMVEGEDLKSKTEFVMGMEGGMETNFLRVFDIILAVAVNGKLTPDQMIKRLFVFSDMEFQQASSNWEDDYEVIVRKFTAKGYGSVVPQIVFWNLKNSRAMPMPAREEGVVLVSGFSKNLLKLFLDEDGDIDPVAFMEAAISGEEYQKLVVLD